MLGSKGIDLPKIAQKLEKISSAKAFEPIKSLDVYNVQAFLKNQYENIVFGVLEEDLRYVSRRAIFGAVFFTSLSVLQCDVRAMFRPHASGLEAGEKEDHQRHDGTFRSFRGDRPPPKIVH